MTTCQICVITNPKGKILPWTAHWSDLCTIPQFLEGMAGKEWMESEAPYDSSQEKTWKQWEAEGYKLCNAEIRIL